MNTTPEFTPEQLRWLLSPIHPSRVSRNPKGFNHLEAWDIRRHLIRLFGFGGFDTDDIRTELVHQKETKPGRWAVIYRSTVRLTVRLAGTELGHWHGTATGAGINLPAADAHDLAIKAADSGALKRAAINLGDQFGLSLYNDGSLEPVVLSSLAHRPDEALPAADAPVKPAPDEQPPSSEVTGHHAPTEAQRTPQPAPAQQDVEREKARAEMLEAAAASNFSDGIAAQFESYFGHPIPEGTKEEFEMARDLMRRG